MKISRTLYVTRRSEWRRWLEKHYKTEPEIWLVFYRKGTGKPRISYNDAVEEALCFRWIDSGVKRLDDERYAQRFSPRKPGTDYSQTNKERLKKLVKQGKVVQAVLKGLPAELLSDKFEVPADIIESIRADREAWRNFKKFPERYKRIRIGFIEGARNRHAEFRKRLNYFIRMSRRNKLFGFGGVDVYYSDSTGSMRGTEIKKT